MEDKNGNLIRVGSIMFFNSGHIKFMFRVIKINENNKIVDWKVIDKGNSGWGINQESSGHYFGVRSNCKKYCYIV